MADQVQLRLILRSVKDWNEWRERHAMSPINLEETDLSWSDLRGANLKDANLKRANLEGADLDDADFEGADLEGANFVASNTDGTNFKDANLDRAEFENMATIVGEGFNPPLRNDKRSPSTAAGPELREYAVNERAALRELSLLIVEQTRINIIALKNERFNSPDANAVIEQLEGTLSTAHELMEGLERNEPSEETEDRIKRLLDSLFDALEVYISSDRSVRTAIAGVAVIASALCGATPIAQVILAASAVGDPGVLASARNLVKGWTSNKKQGKA